jgi:protocatechuate 3,4-dioxygenase beta subunit
VQETRSDPAVPLVLVLALALTLVSRVGVSAQEAKGTGRIRGTVTAADTGMPLRRAAVRLSTTAAPNASTTTDSNGQFEFVDLRAGEYTVTAVKGGFVQLSFGQQSIGGAARRIQLAAGQRFDAAHIKLPRGGVLTGRVFDEFGDPIPEASVQVFRSQYMQGIRRLTAVRTTTSNDIGQFRVYGLAPGTYYLAGTLRSTPMVFQGNPALMPDPERGGEGFAQTFYPAALSPGDARPLTVDAGQEIANLEFALQPVRLARVSGRVVDSRGKPAPGVAVSLNSARSDGVFIGSMRMAQADAEGRFTLPGVGPGDYRVDVRAVAEIEAIARKGGGVGTPQHADAAEFASVPLSVIGSDIEGFVIATSRGHSLSGRLVVEGGALDPASVQKVSVNTFDAGAGVAVSGVMLMAGSTLQPDLTFQIRGLTGTRVVRVEHLPAGWALKAVRVDGIDVTDSGFEIRRADVTDAEVIIARATEIAGTIVDGKGQPAGDRTVIVFPDDSKRWSGYMNRYVTSARAAQDGTFRIAAMPPGTYLAAVVPATDDAEWMAPENLERLRPAATKFILVEGEKKTLRLVLR